MKRTAMTMAAACTLGVLGCTSMTPQEQGTVTGAAIGAAAGAGIAAISGGSGWTGAAIGAVAGGVVGNIKGKQQQ
jgi:osmotically inducible lipoprotein OsmB